MNSIQELIEDIKIGKMVILVDDEDRENEGDLVLAAEHVTTETINFMATHARGLICLSLDPEQVDRLDLPLMVPFEKNFSPNKTAFTISIEASKGVSTGISAQDRAYTIKTAANPNTLSKDISSPGHVFPIRSQKGGVLKRAGHSEGSVDLVKLSKLEYPGAVICEIMNEDGTMARVPQLKEFAIKHNLKIGSIVDLIQFRLQNDSLVKKIAESILPLKFGKDFIIKVYKNLIDDSEHLVIQKGDIQKDQPTLVRVHSECMTGDIFGSLRCDCGLQLESALQMIDKEQSGVVVYLRQEGRGIGLANKIKAYALQDTGMDTVEANVHLGLPIDNRDYGIGSQILRDLGVNKIKLMTNNPSKRKGLKGYGLEIVERVPLIVEKNALNINYLKTKQTKLGHIFENLLENKP